ELRSIEMAGIVDVAALADRERAHAGNEARILGPIRWRSSIAMRDLGRLQVSRVCSVGFEDIGKEPGGNRHWQTRVSACLIECLSIPTCIAGQGFARCWDHDTLRLGGY